MVWERTLFVLLRALFAVLVAVGSGIATAESPHIQGPESHARPGDEPPVFDPPTPEVPLEECQTDSQCSPPSPQVYQHAECLVARCVAGRCATRVLVQKVLPETKGAGPLSCYETSLVCDSNGQAVVSNNPAHRRAVRENELCSEPGVSPNECEKGVCRAGECSVEPNDGATCTNTTANKGSCQIWSCVNRVCAAVASPSKAGAPCGTSTTKNCKTTHYECGATGICETRENLAQGAECAPDGTRASGELLPPRFVALFSEKRTPPKASCDPVSCKLNYCGDGIVQAGEECEDTTPPSSPDRRCRDCVWESLACLYYQIDATVTSGFASIPTDPLSEARRAIDAIVTRWKTGRRARLGTMPVIWDETYPADTAARDINALLSQFRTQNDALKTEKVMSGDTKPLSCLLSLLNGVNPSMERFSMPTNTISASDVRNALKNVDWWNKLNTKDDSAWYSIYSAFYDPNTGPLSQTRNSDESTSYTYAPVYLDHNCQRVTNVADGLVCESVRVTPFISPLSLIMAGGAGINQDWRVVQFKLNPNRSEEQWVLWKASAEAPLLVHDPQHLGRITDGSQLFGNYTFGGAWKGALGVSFDKQTDRKSPWSSGYEALASLDVNRDGKVAGGELADLALWFDENRNAISEPGEVQLLSSHGIIQLSYAYDHQDRYGDFYAHRGFSSTASIGMSVDWYSPIFRSHREAIQALEPSQAKLANHRARAESAGGIVPNVSGAYAWRAKTAQNGAIPDGVLILRDASDGITGISIREEAFAPNKDRLNSRLIGAALRGRKIFRDGKVAIEFEVAGEKGVVTSSFASLEDGELTGTSSFMATVAEGETKVSYEWTATRVR